MSGDLTIEDFILEGEEDIDITAVYDLGYGNGHLDIFSRSREETEAAMNAAIHEALMMHKRAGNSVAVERDGKVVMLGPEDIEE
jgi:hypothetical protein